MRRNPSDRVLCNLNLKGLKMKKDEIQVGMQVCVNDVTDAMIYEIDCIDGFEVHLIYETKMGAVSAGWIDVSMLRKTKQIAQHN